MPRYYVTMTWHDWPEGCSYGTVIEAGDYGEAERLCRLEMARSYYDGDVEEFAERFAVDRDQYESEEAHEDALAEAVVENLGDDWHVVDCFDLDWFIKRYHVPVRPVRPRRTFAVYDHDDGARMHVYEAGDTVVTLRGLTDEESFSLWLAVDGHRRERQRQEIEARQARPGMEGVR